MSKYDGAGKSRARDVVLRIASQLPRGARVLDLYGGGGSVRPLSRIAGLHVVSAERDRDLHPALAKDADAYGFIAHFGNFTEAPGVYDLINLDLNGALSEESLRAAREAAEMLSSDGYLVVTLTGAREADAAFGLRRSLMIPTLLAAETQMRYVFTLTYGGIRNVPMWVTVLVPKGRTLARLHTIRAIVASQGWWAAGYYGWLAGSRADRAKERTRLRSSRRPAKLCGYSGCARSVPPERTKFCSDECARFYQQRDRQREQWTTLRMARPARPCALPSCRGLIAGAVFGQRKYCTTRCRNKAYYLPYRAPARVPRMSDCHPDRRHYARGRCARCWNAQHERERRARMQQSQGQISIAA